MNSKEYFESTCEAISRGEIDEVISRFNPEGDHSFTYGVGNDFVEVWLAGCEIIVTLLGETDSGEGWCPAITRKFYR